MDSPRPTILSRRASIARHTRSFICYLSIIVSPFPEAKFGELFGRQSTFLFLSEQSSWRMQELIGNPGLLSSASDEGGSGILLAVELTGNF